MDLTQSKLTKTEWDSIETPVDENEKHILSLIIQGSENVNIKVNTHVSLLSFMKLSYTPTMESHIYKVYFQDLFSKLSTKYNVTFPVITLDKNSITLKKADEIRFKSVDSNNIKEHKHKIYDFVLYDHIEKILKYKHGEKKSEKKWKLHYFTLYKLLANNVNHINKQLIGHIQYILETYKSEINVNYCIYNSPQIIEKNKELLKYKDISLYSHQKDIFSLFQRSVHSRKSHLILYTAPTGTGKTLTPIGLSKFKKVIFVCAARHVGLALAKASISVNKKIAFAFGCTDAGDVRLHYFAAKDFSVNYKTGGIFKVDNSVGDKVEIMICDVKSYLPAMHYMLAFNEADSLVTYWDEPTISMDYTTHDLHEIVSNNWKENLIPNFVLSSATLPKMDEIFDVISFFKNKFTNVEVSNIESCECSKSISLVDSDGYIVMPHYISDDYQSIKEVVQQIKQNKTILRYLDLQECVNFIEFVEKNNFIQRSASVERYFNSLDDITMSSIKIHYLTCLDSVLNGTWGSIFLHFKLNKTRRISYNDYVDEHGMSLRKVNSIGPGCIVEESKTELKRQASLSPNVGQSQSNQCSVYVTTKDAYSLTDGPTIYLTNSIHKISSFCIAQASIPSTILKELYDKIGFNNKIQEKIQALEERIEEEVEKLSKNDKNDDMNNKKKSTSEEKIYKNANIHKLQEIICELRSETKNATLDDIYIPNSKKHIKKWYPVVDYNENSFTSMIDDSVVQEIMLLPINNAWKILLIMGIGVFTSHDNIAYREIIKKLTDEQKLYLIIADSDYIYGTNYQFCHGILGKDLELSQEKLIQALGRIGRNNIQQSYTIRFRNPSHHHLLFKLIPSNEKIEVTNMNKLFSH